MLTSHFSPEVMQIAPWLFAMDGDVEREHMFEKPLTPSDVGKLNRLVIPKQHAEKYFPLAGDSRDKGLLLSFEDAAGKAWRFRYSYWTSSQSYVLTKGWSRFVKENQLYAGDVVLFERSIARDRFYIGCRRRGLQDGAPAHNVVVTNAPVPWSQAFYDGATPAGPPPCLYMGSMQQDCIVQRELMNGGEQMSSMVQNVAVPKRLRLFGVNLECMPDHPETEPEHPTPWFMDHNPDCQGRFTPSNASTSQL